MLQKKRVLQEIVRKKGIVVRNHELTLSSGEKSYYYYDLKKISLDPEAINLIGDLLLEEILLKFGKVKSVGGMESGAVPLIASVVMKSTNSNSHLTGFYVRKERKAYGLQKVIEGKITEPVVIIDDVITTGSSIREVVNTVKEEGFDVRGVFALLDREQNHELKKIIDCYSLLRHSDFASYIDEQLRRKKQSSSY